VAARLQFNELSSFGLSDLDLAACCHFTPGEDPHFSLCSYHEGFVTGFTKATTVETTRGDITNE
jgi:hypothetical protein